MNSDAMPTALVLVGGATDDHDPLSTLIEHDLLAQGLEVQVAAVGDRSLQLVEAVRRLRNVDVVVVNEPAEGLIGRVLARCLRWSARPVLEVRLDPTPGLQGARIVNSNAGAVVKCVTRRVSIGQVTEVSRKAEWRAALAAAGVARREKGRDGTGPLTLDDLDEIVSIHMAAFPDSAMTGLGRSVIERYYRWQFIGPHPAPHAGGCWSDGTLVGFLFGGVRLDAVSGFARRFMPTILRGAFRHPMAIAGLLGPNLVGVMRLTFFRRRVGRAPVADQQGVRSPSTGGQRLRSFGVLSIAVLPEARGSGAASELMDAAEVIALAGGFSRMHLSVSRENGRARRFYERLGWQDEGQPGSATTKLVHHL